ncbi:MAG: hypothetical protein KJP21_00765, partial [Bacteroidia bacterium]|nr:hypothetical protein [Bacteroidia bacterium]
MKNILKCFVVVILGFYLTTAAISCQDKTEPVPEPEVFDNEMVIDGVIHNLAHGELLKLEEHSPGVYYAPIYIVTDDFQRTESTISGVGHAMEITVVTNRLDYISPGAYTFKDDIYTSSVLVPNTFIAGVFMDWNLANFEVSGFYEEKSGSLTIDYQ